ncbi:hypothetical protein V5O48_010274 [Marasmius crinis-equi]|uniref:Microtubule associated protein n=1 Tax=Marasmius crinis-equi TaxID=585013 RepID=A0ABR3F8X4_9AGAR
MDGPPPPEEDFSSMSISERLAHKNWKARVSAYESLVKTFQTTASDDDPAFKPYVNNPDLLKKIATDSNAVAQEKGVECLVALIKFAGGTAARTRETVAPALVEKCFGSARGGTKAQALELVLQYVEVENSGTGVVNDILPGLSAKQPKTVAGCVTALKEVVRTFGTQVTPPPPVLKALPKIFGHTDKAVRAEGTALTHVLYQYLGPGIESWLNDLKPVQVKELKEAFENMEREGKGKGSLKPERLTRAQAREAESAAASGEVDGEEAGGEGAAEDPVNLDPRAFAEPVDITPKLPSTMSAMLTSSKWKERKEVLDELNTLLTSTPRISDAPEIGGLAKALATRIQGDANINCVMTAASCMEALAKGMMTSFARYREAVVPLMLERLKERKTNVTDSIGAALDAVFASTTLADILPDLMPALSSKNPQVKEGTLKFLCRCLSTATKPIPSSEIKPLADTLSTLLEDGFEGARNEAASCMGTLMKMVGERPLNAVIDGLADVRKAKIKEAHEKATVKCKAGAGGPPKAAPPKAAAPAKKKAPAEKPPAAASKPPPTTVAEDLEQPAPPKKPLGKPPARLLAQKEKGVGPPTAPPTASAPAAAKKPLPAVAAKPTKAAPPAAPGALDTFKYKHTPEDADALAADLIPSNILADLTDANWKTRLAALDEMNSWLEGIAEDVDAEVVIRALAKKGWAEKNFQVSAKIYGVCSLLAGRSRSFGRSCVALCVPHLSEKLGDMKLKKPAGDTLLVFAEKTSLQFVLNQAYDSLSKQKAPKVLADAITWINSAITEFGIAGLSLRSMIDFLKTALQNSNATVRTSATKTLVTLKLFAGSSIKDLLEDLNPQLLNTITSEFDKVDGTAPPEPTRVSADVAAMPTTASKGGAGGGGADALDDLFPRVEIDGLLKGTTILADAKSDAWKTKKEALETLQAILDQGSNKRLKPNMGEIAQVLKARVVDANKAVQALALDIVARIATGMGKPFEKQNKFFVLPVCTVLADQKAPIRNAALSTLTAIATACEGLESMVPGLTSGLETANPLQKGTLLNWTVEWFKEHELTPSLDISNWAGPVVTSLDDRNSEVRKAAQALLPTLIASAGFDFVLQQTNSLKPASRNSAVPLIQAARPAHSDTPPAAPPSKSKLSAPAPASAPVVEQRAPSPAEAPVSKAPTSKLTGVRRKLPLGSSRPESRADAPPETPAPGSRLGKPALGGLKRPGASIASSKPTSAAPSPGPSLPLIGTNTESRKTRCGKDTSRWINEGGPTRKDLADLLQSQMESHASKELHSRLFSHDHNAINDHIAGLGMLCDVYNAAQSGDEAAEVVCLANFDFPLKYTSMKLHEPQPNLISKCLETVEAVLGFLRNVNYQLTDNEALCFIPTVIHKLGDAREQVRVRVSQIIQSLPKVYAYSRIFQLLLDYGLKSKVAKTRQGSLDELGNLLKKYGMTACEPPKAFPVIASMIADKDSAVRKSALGTISEGYVLVGEKVWALVGPLAPKDKTQLEERLRRVAGPSGQEKAEAPVPSQISRLAAGGGRPASPALSSRIGGIPRPASPAVPGPSRIGRPASPAHGLRSTSPAPALNLRPNSPSKLSKMPAASHLPVPPSPTTSSRPKTALPSRLGKPRSHFSQPSLSQPALAPPQDDAQTANGSHNHEPADTHVAQAPVPEDITLMISSILSSDATRSVDALKKVQKILNAGPSGGSQYSELAEHTEGLVETITLQMAHVFERPESLAQDENFRLAKHLIQTLNNFCDHPVLAESLTVDILTALLEELTLRLLETDDSPTKQVKDLSRFINMIILRIFAMGRKMSIFRALFALLLQIVKPFAHNGATVESKEAKVAELVLKCVWKLARSIPQDLTEQKLDPVELFPAIEHFLQSVPPNDWRARATNKVPCGDMPLRTIKVIIQHVVGKTSSILAHYGDDVYDLLSAAFDDPSATIVYPYVYRILNSTSRGASDMPAGRHEGDAELPSRPLSTTSSRAISPQETASSASASHRNSSPSRPDSFNGHNGYPPPAEEPDPDAQLLTIIGHISSETTGALHKEGITELHHFLKAYPHKRPRVEKILESTGAAFRKYINRALASRAAEDEERNAAVADTLSKPRTVSMPVCIICKVPYVCPPNVIEEGNAMTPTLGAPRRGAARRVLGVQFMMAPAFHSSHLTYDVSIVFWKLIVNIFFREIRPRGAFNIPRDGPVILVAAPHNNQFLDPLLLALQVHKETGRHVQFLTAAASMKRKAVGFFTRLMKSIPVERAADNAKNGTGKALLSDEDPCLVLGEGTKFLSEFSPRMQILLPKSVDYASAEVVEVISDTELRIKRELSGDKGKSTSRVREKVAELQKNGEHGIEFKTLPYVNQQDMYRYVYDCLQQGGSIGIFPEGGSHDRTDLLPLKAGVSVMALGAMANDPNCRVKIVPCGFSYFHPHRFRSRAVVEFGTALDVPEELVEMFKQGGAQKRDAVAKFLDLIYDGLKTVTLIQAVRRLYKTPSQHLTLGQVVELNRRLLEGYTHFKDDPRIQKLRADVLKYNRLLRDLGLRDHQVPRAQKASWKTLGLLTYRVGLLAVWAVLALPGTILNGPMFILASVLSRKKAKEALAKSTVKIAGKDVLATWKVLISLGVAPLLYSFYAFLAVLVMIRAQAPMKWRIMTPFMLFLVLPFMNFAALKFGEAGMDVLKSLRPLIVALIPGQQRSLDKLKDMRVQLANEVAGLINDLGPKLYPDFNETRILVPSASVPPSTGTPGIWRRKSSTGAVDAQGLGLTHPMTWIDERLFGWSKSARRGTSAWGGFMNFDEPSRAGTPDGSEEEDAGDYEHVVGLLPDEHLKSRSRTNSYAELQRLRSQSSPLGYSSQFAMSPATAVSEEDQLSFRTGRRERKASLSAQIPVERIAQVNQQEPFGAATNDLNNEARHAKHD